MEITVFHNEMAHGPTSFIRIFIPYREGNHTFGIDADGSTCVGIADIIRDDRRSTCLIRPFSSRMHQLLGRVIS
jgi:hypothetical protein